MFWTWTLFKYIFRYYFLGSQQERGSNFADCERPKEFQSSTFFLFS